MQIALAIRLHLIATTSTFKGIESYIGDSVIFLSKSKNWNSVQQNLPQHVCENLLVPFRDFFKSTRLTFRYDFRAAPKLIMYATISNYHTILKQQSRNERVSQKIVCIINVRRRAEILLTPPCQNKRAPLPVLSAWYNFNWWNRYHNDDDHNALCGVLNRPQALCGVLNRPKSALWCEKLEKPNYFRE